MVDKHRTMRGPTQKKKTGCNFVRKENNAGGARGQVHGEKKNDDTSMDVESKEVGAKRKERILLEEISMDDEIGKNQKLDGEVMALGKIMAQHLGSALAVGQPCREQ